MLAAEAVYCRVEAVVDQSWKWNDGDEQAKTSKEAGSAPRQPAEFPMNVPRRVIELRMLLILSLALDTARGLRAPSRSPHTPPRVSPEEGA